MREDEKKKGEWAVCSIDIPPKNKIVVGQTQARGIIIEPHFSHFPWVDAHGLRQKAQAHETQGI